MMNLQYTLTQRVLTILYEPRLRHSTWQENNNFSNLGMKNPECKNRNFPIFYRAERLSLGSNTEEELKKLMT